MRVDARSASSPEGTSVRSASRSTSSRLTISRLNGGSKDSRPSRSRILGLARHLPLEASRQPLLSRRASPSRPPPTGRLEEERRRARAEVRKPHGTLGQELVRKPRGMPNLRAETRAALEPWRKRRACLASLQNRGAQGSAQDSWTAGAHAVVIDLRRSTTTVSAASMTSNGQWSSCVRQPRNQKGPHACRMGGAAPAVHVLARLPVQAVRGVCPAAA